MKLTLLLTILLGPIFLRGQQYVTNNPVVEWTNCDICTIKQVVVDKEYTKILVEIKAQSKGNSWVSFSEWTALATYESKEQVSKLRKFDVDIPQPASSDPTYLSIWRDIAEQRRALQKDLTENANLILALENGELNTKYSLRSREANQVFRFWLKFDPLPMGIEDLLMIELTEDGWEFAGIKIKNPDTSPKTTWSEVTIKDDWSKNGIHPPEGIYEKSTSDDLSPKYRLAIKRNSEDENYSVIYLSGSESRIWKAGHVKAKLSFTATENLYKTIWYMADKTIADDMYTSFSPGLMKISRFDKSSEEIYIKLYPAVSGDHLKANRLNSSGTGFALSNNGYIVTNYHVIQESTMVRVRGIKGNFSHTYNAKVIIEDSNNDIAILKIEDSDFRGLGNPPYKIANIASDVGVSVYALGYPLRASMGDEVKLTNGIISSKTGYRGDITSYQTSVPVQPGNSGGPLLDAKGNIIGLINAKHMNAENASYAVKTAYLLNLIQAMNEPPSLPANNNISNRTLSDQVKLVKDFVYIIETE